MAGLVGGLVGDLVDGALDAPAILADEVVGFSNDFIDGAGGVVNCIFDGADGFVCFPIGFIEDAEDAIKGRVDVTDAFDEDGRKVDLFGPFGNVLEVEVVDVSVFFDGNVDGRLHDVDGS